MSRPAPSALRFSILASILSLGASPLFADGNFEAGVAKVPARLAAPLVPGKAARISPAGLPKAASLRAVAPATPLSLPATAVKAAADPAAGLNFKPPLPRGPQAPQERKTSIGALGEAASGRVSLRALYENSARPRPAWGVVAEELDPLELRSGAKVEAGIRVPQAGALTQRSYHFSKGRAAQGGISPIELKSDPKDSRAIEAELRALFESKPELFGLADAHGNSAISGMDLATVHVQRLEGDAHRAETIHAVFRQWQRGLDRNGRDYFLLVYGGTLSVTIKNLGGKLVIKGIDGRFYPVTAPMTPKFSEDALQSIAARHIAAALRLRRKLSRPKAKTRRLSEDRKPSFLTREIIPDSVGEWHAANIYQGADLNGRPVNVAVDINTGATFAWDGRGVSVRHGPLGRFSSKRRAPARVVFDAARLKPASGGGSAELSGSVAGRGNSIQPAGDDNGPIAALPMAHLKIVDSKGKTVGLTDENGKFTIQGPSGPVVVKASLDGAYARVVDAHKSNKPLTISLTLAPGGKNEGVINPGDDAELASDVNSYAYYSDLHGWLKAIGVNDAQMDSPLTINTNKSDMPCNAYYDPTTDTLNLEAESRDCENTAQASIIMHEATHRVVQLHSQLNEGFIAETARRLRLKDFDAFRYALQGGLDSIMGDGVNEGIADTASMFRRDYPRGNPYIGQGFFKSASKPKFLRWGENKAQLDPAAEAHAQGEAFMGATWMIHQGFVEAMGLAAGAAYAAAVVLPTVIFGQPQDVAAAMAQILLAVTDKKGNSPYADIVRKAAEAHGIPLPDNVGRPSA